MGERSIIAVGISLASDDVEYCDFDSNDSLLDWDVVLFRPDISQYYSYSGDYYQGKPSLGDTASFGLKERCEHWRREIKDAVEGGKTVIVFLPDIQEVWVDTGRREHSGTGRSRQTTRIVEPYNNYKTIPADIKPIGTKGSAIKLAARGAECLASYWNEFEGHSQYKVVLGADKVPASLITRNGDKPVGAIYKDRASGGALVLVPDVQFIQEGFVQKVEGEEEDEWTEAAKSFACRLVGAVFGLDKALHAADEVTAEPSWAKAADYALQVESELNERLLLAETTLENARKAKEQLLEELKASGSLRALLYEKGKPLENAIIEGLKTLGFVAEPFVDANSEFDVVFESPEGRLIGEAEGKDNKAISIEKLRQLAMNIHEDLQREEVTSPAKGVLFGNPFRLIPVAERATPFTEKCLRSAESSSIGLLATYDLYLAVRHLKNTPDSDYAKRCRVALVTGVGSVSLPRPPAAERLPAEAVRSDA